MLSSSLPSSTQHSSRFFSHTRSFPKMTENRMGVLYNVNMSGTGRLIFNEERTKFLGVITGSDGECLSVHGERNKIDSGSATPSTSTMTVFIIDGETGVQFQVPDVTVNFLQNPNSICSSRYFVYIDNPNICFTTNDVLCGNRADVEIQTYMNPRMVERGLRVHVGDASVQLNARHRFHPSVRHESFMDDSRTVILDQSENDFLA
ncbi:hypothetical protein AB6A40_001572 [Gnathostoma spinigerum]|uniref:ZP domain-containing protein n=1 Tax=Gnathostoma spinigerum TaxID=75299 RepID=A0ABD6EDE7_9BILA